MEIEFFGANCFRIKTKQATIVVDDDLDKHGAKTITKEADVLLVTNRGLNTSSAASRARLTLESPGEFEIGDISVSGIQARGHMDEEDKETATVFQCSYAGATVTVIGHIHPDISNTVQELAGGTDVLLLPVGGNGYTLDAVGAVTVMKAIEPDVVIPAHYDMPGLSYEVPAAPIEEFVKTSGLAAQEGQDVYRAGKALESGQTELVILNVKKT